jgi:Calcineurin-like phosphoesterase
VKKISDDDFIASWGRHKSPILVAKDLGLSLRATYGRRERLAHRGVRLDTADLHDRKTAYTVDAGTRTKFERRRTLEVKNGTVVVFSDPHFYPDSRGTALAALLDVIKEVKPVAVICGGDALDGTQIGRHEPVRGWAAPPALSEQLQCMTESMTRIKAASPKGSVTMMTLGNHDARLERYLCTRAPYTADLPGTRLEDYIPSWPLSWTIEVNGNLIVRHRNVGGMLHLQAQKAGCHYVHGHLHKLNVHAVSQYHQFLFSVDAGSLSDPHSEAFDYHEDGPPHVQGFAVLTFEDGRLLWPELCYIRDGTAYFRGSRV